MSRPEKKKSVIWTLENTEPEPPEDEISPPFRGLATKDSPGTFQIREPGATIGRGWDLVGQWEMNPDHGLIILTIQLEPSTFVTDGCPPGRLRPRLRDGSEWSSQGIKFEDLKRIRVSRVREAIRKNLHKSLTTGFFFVPEDQDTTPLVQRQIEVVSSAVADRPRTGRRRTTEVKLDEWARDVIDCLSDRSRPLYEQLAKKWAVTESSVKNHRLPQLRETGRLAGKGRKMIEGPNYPKEMENKNG